MLIAMWGKNSRIPSSTRITASALISISSGNTFPRNRFKLLKPSHSDYNFIRNSDYCEPVGPEPIPAGICSSPDQTYRGSSGWRKIPGNTCTGGLKKDEKVEKKCSQGTLKGSTICILVLNVEVLCSSARRRRGYPSNCAYFVTSIPTWVLTTIMKFEFRSQIVQYSYFKNSRTILVRLADFSVWQSSNEGYSWTEPVPNGKFLVFYHHKFSDDRAFLITDSEKFHYTTDTGRNWHLATAPTPPNSFRAQVLHFHPNSDFLIWTGNRDCGNGSPNCRAEAQFSRDNGRRWTFIESYVRNCAFAKDTSINADPNEIICESYREKSGNQRLFTSSNMLELVVGGNFFQYKKKLFNAVVGFAKFSEYLVVAEVFIPPYSGKVD